MIQTLLDRLDKVKSRGQNKWIACCPAHDDRSPSLAVQELSDGRILMKCFAGCDTPSVMASVGLSMSDLYPTGSLGEFKGWERLQADIRRNKDGVKAQKLHREKTVLEIADDMRKQGKRLTPEEMKQEEQAFLRMRNADNN